ncbi:MAG: radical SAM protein [Spirochaetales bacterium]|nr:radical SAM protein [Spirochaetales bacterium]
MSFPSCISFTITNRCNLRCQMCGQWSKLGYLRDKADGLKKEMQLEEWKRLVDELETHNIKYVLLRGGEPFLFPGIIELLEYINRKAISVSIDTNGTLIEKYAKDIVRIGNIHLTISVDGPEAVHDAVRSAKGCFSKIRRGVLFLNNLQQNNEQKISTSINFTISSYSVNGLGRMPDVARSLGVNTITIVPYYYVPAATGKKYERELKENLGCRAFSWVGFQHEDSGVDFDVFKREYERYLTNLNGLYNYPYMAFSLEDYKMWFADSATPVGKLPCTNVEKLIDIQPNGDANFCVDFPDYIIGNVRNRTIEEVWNSAKAERFRVYRRKKPLAVCYRCGAKYMSEQSG